MVSSQELTPLGVDQAIYQTVRNTPGGAAAIAAQYGLPHQVLVNNCNPNYTDRRVSLHQLECILQAAHDPAPLLNSLAALTKTGGQFVPWIELDSRDTEGTVLTRVLELVDAVGKYGAEAKEALANDGRVDCREWVALQGAALAVLQEVHMLLNLLERKRG